MNMLLVLVLLFFSVNKAFIYHDGPVTRSEAKAYCESQGSTLATITNDGERLEALIAMNGKPFGYEYHPWIGLIKENNVWSYPDDPNAVCPSHVGCVGHYWYNEQPKPDADQCDHKCCAFFCNGLYNGNGGIINGKCDEKRPYLCSEPVKKLCDVEDYTSCGGLYTLCNPDGGSGVNLEGWLCICDHNSFGVSHCRSGVYCDQQTYCPNGDGDCPNGEICLSDSCCSQDICSPLCDETLPPYTRRLLHFELDESVEPCLDIYCPKGDE